MKTYGSRVVGEEAAAAALVMAKKKGREYGPKVLGSSVDQSEEGKQKRAELPARGQRSKLPPESDNLDALVAKYATNDGYLSIKDVQTVLAEMPEAFDRLVGWELGRDDGPRIGALSHFIELETARTGGVRPTILKNLETALTAVRSKGKG